MLHGTRAGGDWWSSLKIAIFSRTIGPHEPEGMEHATVFTEMVRRG
jgi:hypothetical protein